MVDVNSEAEAAKRVLIVTPQVIRQMNDTEIGTLMADLAIIGYGRSAAKHMRDLGQVREKLSDARYWASILLAAHKLANGQKSKPPAGKSALKTRAQRIEDIAARAECGITAAEVNEWLQTLPPVEFA